MCLSHAPPREGLTPRTSRSVPSLALTLQVIMTALAEGHGPFVALVEQHAGASVDGG